MSELIVASNGRQIPIGDLAVTLANTGGQVTTMTVVYAGITYVRTFTYDGAGVVTNISQWVAQ